MDVPVLYEDNDCMVVDKPAGITVFQETNTKKSASPAGRQDTKTLIDLLLEKYPALKSVGEDPRYGMVHRLDKDTSGVLLVAKRPEALIFLQKQFKNRGVEKKYLALATGVVREDSETIEALLGRSPQDPRKQKVYKATEPAPERAREAVTHYKVLQRFATYTLLEVTMETGRRHQVRAHLAFIHHPLSPDAFYLFKKFS